MFHSLRRISATATVRTVARTGAFSPRRFLSLHEHQAQTLLAEHGAKVPFGRVATSAQEAAAVVDEIGGRAVLKAQIHAGGRGKGSFDNGLRSGVHVVSSGAEAQKLALQMFGHKLMTNQTRPEGLLVNQLYVAEQLDVVREYYLAFTVSREHYAPTLLVSKGGGTGVEQLAAQRPDGVLSIPLRYSQGITDDVVNAVCEKLALGQGKYEEVKNLLTNLYRMFRQSDATLLEINPLVESGKNGQLICADTKLTIDNAAKPRQAELFNLRDLSQENPTELEAEKHGLVYIQLDGAIGCLVNGAGLAMATNDAVSHFGGQCANFLDGGGQATVSTMKQAFELILRDKKVNTILVNIYGGIIRCDMIAEAVIAAAKQIPDIPVVVRLQGTNAEKGQRMVADSDLKLFAESEFDGAVKKAIELSRRTNTQPPHSGPSANLASKHQARRSFATTTLHTSQHAKLENSMSTSKQQKRAFTSSSPGRGSYEDSRANLLINHDTRVMYQGFTGQTASSFSLPRAINIANILTKASRNAQEAIKYGTNVVGGVSRSSKASHGMHFDTVLSSLPVFGTVRQAVEEIRPDATAVFVPAQFAAEAIIESIEAEVPLIVSVAEHIPVHDMLRVQEVLRTQSKSRLVGPNCPGIISPSNHCKIGIMPHLEYMPGIVGIASKSGTLSYEAVGSTTKAGLGQSLCVGVGGDLLPGTSLVDAVTAMIKDPATKGVVLLGEIGGDAEIEASALVKEYRAAEIKAGKTPKPFVGMVAGRTAPKGKVMGHAGAISGGSVSAEDKLRAMQDAGIVVPAHPGEIGEVMKALLKQAESL